MTCTKCGGLVIKEYDDERCINCGRRPYDIEREADSIPVKEAITVGAAWTPERRAKFEATVAAKKAQRGEKAVEPKKRKESALTDGAPGKPSVPAVQVGRQTKVRVLPAAGTSALAGIDEAITKLQDDLVILEQAKEVLARHSR